MSKSNTQLSKQDKKDYKEKQKQQKKNNGGKPANLKKNKLEAPDIWTNNELALKTILFCHKEGRNNLLHKAGKKCVDESAKMKQQLEMVKLNEQKPYYEVAEHIMKELFNTETFTKRCLVFFFRQPCSIKTQIELNQYQLGEAFTKALNMLQNLFEKLFFEELLNIITQEYPQIGYKSQIWQSQFIKNILEKMKNHEVQPQHYLKMNKIELDDEFKKFHQSNIGRDNVNAFIQEIKHIFTQMENVQYMEPLQNIENDFDLDLSNDQDIQNYQDLGADFEIYEH